MFGPSDVVVALFTLVLVHSYSSRPSKQDSWPDSYLQMQHTATSIQECSLHWPKIKVMWIFSAAYESFWQWSSCINSNLVQIPPSGGLKRRVSPYWLACILIPDDCFIIKDFITCIADSNLLLLGNFASESLVPLPSIHNLFVLTGI